MSYSYDRRTDGVYLLTGEKHKDKDIVIKMGSTLKEEHMVDTLTRASFTVKWTIEESEDDSKIVINGKIKGENYRYAISKSLVVKQLVNMVKKKLTMESCTLITEAMSEGYNAIFTTYLDDKGVLLSSNNIVKGHVIIREKGKAIGAASRFVYTQGNLLYICEYTGKLITKDTEVTVSVDTEKTTVKYRIRGAIGNGHIKYNPSQTCLGYLEYEATVYNICNNEGEYPEIAPLKVSRTYSDPERMAIFCRDNNTTEKIDRYKILLKPKVEIIDINRFMLREFTV